MKIEVEEITPQRAVELLEHNTANRPLNSSHASFLSNQMKQGKWLEAGDPIRISAGGRLLDGQHRLWAILDSGVTLKLIVISELPDETFTVMDTGRVRTASDLLAIEKMENAKPLSALARMILNYQMGYTGFSLSVGVRTRRKNPLSNGDILTFARENNLQPFINAGKHWHKLTPLFTVAEYALLYYLLYQKSDVFAQRFFEALASGIGLVEDSPVYLLRKRLENSRMQRSPLPPKDRMALVFKAWNFYREHRTTTAIVWYANREEFPMPV